jgi:8-oxo-dGTP diphosphatase
MIQATGFLHSVTTFISEKILYLLIAVLVLNMLQRRHQAHGQGKRFATLYIAILILAFMVGTTVIVFFDLPDVLVLPLAAAAVLIGYRYRKKVFPFRLSCRLCGQRLSARRILFYDSNICERCAEDEQRGEAAEPGQDR